MSELLLPDGFMPLTNQVAGHTFSPQNRALGMLQNKDAGCILKPLGKPQCGERELRFYQELSTINDGISKRACHIVPKFYEKCKLLVSGGEHVFLKLEDLTHGMIKPCIMDIKIGQRTWDPLATEQKRQIEEEKYMKCKKGLGLCLPGFQVYHKHPITKELTITKQDKEYGKQLDPLGLQQTIAFFLQSEKPTEVCQPLVEECLKQLYTIQDWFNIQRLYHFYASSLLIVYDYEKLQSLLKNTQIQYDKLENGNEHLNIIQSQHIGDALSNVPCDNDDCQQFSQMNLDCLVSPDKTFTLNNDNISNFVKIRMIDFAHVFPANDSSPDTNYIFGLKNLINILENILKCR